jgi:ribonuclease PH
MDSNIILTESGKILEIQMTAESKPCDGEKLVEIMRLANKGVGEIIQIQKEVLGKP